MTTLTVFLKLEVRQGFSCHIHNVSLLFHFSAQLKAKARYSNLSFQTGLGRPPVWPSESKTFFSQFTFGRSLGVLKATHNTRTAWRQARKNVCHHLVTSLFYPGQYPGTCPNVNMFLFLYCQLRCFPYS